MSVKFELRITISNEGELRVHGPIGDKIACLGVLEVAKDVIKNYRPQEQSNIVVPKISVVQKQS